MPLEHFFDAYFRNGWLRAPFGQAAEAPRLRAVRDPGRGCRWSWPQRLPSSTRREPHRAPSNLVFSGPVVATAPARDLAIEPSVLVSLSTYNFPGQTEAMQNILDAVRASRRG